MSERERKIKKAQRELRSALRLATDMNEHHGTESWAEFDPEGAELLSHSVAEVRAATSDLTERGGEG